MFWGSSSNGLPLHLPLPEGSYVPGCMDVTTDPHQSEKPCLLRLYYPTDLPKNENHSYRWIPWASYEYLLGISTVAGIWTWVIRLVFKLLAGDVHIPIVWGGSPRQKGPPMPVIVLSHGLGGSRFFYSTTCVELASQGFLVAALEHRDASACTTYRRHSEGVEWVSYVRLPKDTSKHAELRESQVAIRAAECRSVITVLEKLNAGSISGNDDSGLVPLSQLEGRLNFSSLVMMGHSFGAATALKTLGQEPRLKAGIILDAWMYPINKEKETLPATVTQPLLFINTQTFHIDKNLAALRRYTQDHPVYTIRGTTHEHQTDTPHLLGSWMNRKMRKTDYKIATKINTHLILSWLVERVGYGVADQEFLTSQAENIIPDLVLATETL